MAKTEVTVVVVEEEEGLRYLFKDVLVKAGFQVLTFMSAEDFLEQGMSHLGDFDVVVLDYLMSGMDGQELCRRIKAACPELPVIIESGTVGQAFVDECRAAGADQVLIKPFTNLEFLNVVEATYQGL